MAFEAEVKDSRALGKEEQTMKRENRAAIETGSAVEKSEIHGADGGAAEISGAAQAMRKIDYILDFALHVGRELLECGANTERVRMSIHMICKAYDLREVCVFVLNSHLAISGRFMGGAGIQTVQTEIPNNGIHLAKLRRLNNMVHDVCRDKPEPEQLGDLLFEALMAPSYPEYVQLLGYILAMVCLGRIFGGGLSELIVVALDTVILFYITMRLARLKLNRIITNVVCMFIVGSVDLLFTWSGFAKDLYCLIITNAFYLIPGIPMVNGFRSLLCGFEMNGIMELVKVVLEVLTIVAGLFLAYVCFGQGVIQL
ncbi:MAG: threonine/serine exporter family protein [Eubacteriales bacterium]|nr:threonine/serine exporter family protein [Eubacteriales bacterium]